MAGTLQNNQHRGQKKPGRNVEIGRQYRTHRVHNTDILTMDRSESQNQIDQESQDQCGHRCVHHVPDVIKEVDSRHGRGEICKVRHGRETISKVDSGYDTACGHGRVDSQTGANSHQSHPNGSGCCPGTAAGQGNQRTQSTTCYQKNRRVNDFQAIIHHCGDRAGYNPCGDQAAH